MDQLIHGALLEFVHRLGQMLLQIFTQEARFEQLLNVRQRDDTF